MSDFYQHDLIATLHRLNNPDPEELEQYMIVAAVKRPIALILPVTYEDSQRPTFEHVLKTVAEVPFINRVIVTVGLTYTLEEFVSVYSKVKKILPESTVIWASGPRMTDLAERMEAHDLPVGGDGKGRNVWFAYGNIFAEGGCRVIALHDSDIVNYKRELLARLAFPTTTDIHTFEFSKGYYSRVTDRMYGRVTRLFVTPLIRSFRSMLGDSMFLRYMDSFRYPLAGEFSMSATLARGIQVPGDWGLEVGTLAEVFRNAAPKRICQVDIAESYEHKHQGLGHKTRGGGLAKMAEDIAKVFLRTLASQGAVFSPGHMNTLVAIYRRKTSEITEMHEADAMLNRLVYDRHNELLAVETFAEALVRAGDTFLTDPLGKPQIPSWNRVLAADRQYLEAIWDIPEQDMQEAEEYINKESQRK